jgi:long-chain fatty acid transport protein
LTQFKGTQFTLGATFYQPVVDVTHDGTVTGAAFSARSGTDIFPIPNVAVTQDLSPLGFPVVLGLGVTVVSGIGAEFKDEPRSLGASAELVVLGVNMGAGMKLSDELSLGGAMTVSYGSLDAGLASSGALVHDTGFRGTVGLNYNLTPTTTVAAYYQTELLHTFDNIFQTGSDPSGFPIYSDQNVDQPANIGFGISNRDLMDGNLLLSADLLYKYWSDADFWQDIYDDQIVVTAGAQLSNDKWRYRIGYGYGDDPNRANPTKLGTLTSIRSGIPGITIPISTPVIQYIQATQTEVIYEHRLTVGIGYKDFLMPGFDLDFHFGWQFEGDRNFGGHTRAEVHSFHGGFGLTWRFQ